MVKYWTLHALHIFWHLIKERRYLLTVSRKRNQNEIAWKNTKKLAAHLILDLMRFLFFLAILILVPFPTHGQQVPTTILGFLVHYLPNPKRSFQYQDAEPWTSCYHPVFSLCGLYVVRAPERKVKINKSNLNWMNKCFFTQKRKKKHHWQWLTIPTSYEDINLTHIFIHRLPYS